MRWIKDPDARLDYTIDFSTYLGTDTISSVAWTAPGLTVNATTNTTTTATIWLSGGSAGKVYRVRCRINTAGARTDDRTFEIEVTHR
jgi:hypothetical protein